MVNSSKLLLRKWFNNISENEMQNDDKIIAFKLK